ncbi:alkaline shock response membrane anchor protein AmaP [Paenibacillus sp. LHD-117]|uniref:alkaline shock response membrane anchor protein AmaP n=1 Tax=Paenibacillus sp. LHD-117 TaxID=3071412 RepID=UPI0027E11017|nr:alkaline shock response membrane anchor protein AmaP [Paenibacillus sp. LHD-117]MDQ6421047.1 alkaline shock response membrane anchor protein AmaP [Paenibacillus sp. LHD-117]
MIKVVDKLMLFLYSLIVGVISIFLMSLGFGWLTSEMLEDLFTEFYRLDGVQIGTGIAGVVLLLLSFRFFILSLHRGSMSAQSIDQRTEYGDIRISIETIENLALKTGSKQRGVKELRARVRASDAGLEIVLRAVIDGESSIPALTEEIQRAVKEHVEEITGIPVMNVAVFVANVVQANTFKSRVE